MDGKALNFEFIFRSLRSFVLSALVGVCVCFAALQLGDYLTKRRLIVGLVACSIPLIAVITRRARQVFLFAWVVSFTYARSYYFFGFLGDYGSHSLYFIAADVSFLILLAIWAYEAAVLKAGLAAQGGRLWPWYLPFALFCALSILGADKKAWAIFELVRVLKLGLILLYVRFNVKREEWWVCVGAFGFGIAAQSSLAVVQITTKKGVSVLAGESWIRAIGTMGHPNILAPYLLLLCPLFLALGVAVSRPAIRVLCTLTGLLGLVGLVCTLSRAPWVLAVGQLIALALGLTLLGVLPVKRAIGLLSVAGLAVALTIVPFAEKLMDRITRNLSESLEFRGELNRIALEMFSKNPYLGVGLNNFSAHVLEYDPDLEWAVMQAEYAKEMGIRVIVAVHNLYLLLLAETGILGLASFLVFILGALYVGMRAIRRSEGVWSAASVGLLLGMLGVLGHMFTDFAPWTDSVLYPFALVLGMLNNVPTLGRSMASSTGIGESGP